MAGRPTKMMTKSAYVVIGVIICALLADIISLGRLQLVDPYNYKEKAAAQHLSDVTVSAQRGTIYDSKMNVLAQSATAWKIYIDPSKIPDEELDNAVKGLVEILGVNEEKLRKNASNKKSGYYVVASQVENKEKDEVNAFRLNNAGYHLFIGIESDNKRYYPNNNFASAILGFTNADDNGVYGLESKYNGRLTGIPGRTITAVNANRFKMSNEFESTYDAQPGTNLVLTIDQVVQSYLEKALTQAMVDNKARHAYGIVMDVKTGAILGMSSLPDFNVNDPYEIADEEARLEIDKITNPEQKSAAQRDARFAQWNNLCISEAYDPGSVFKTITAAAGLEEGVVKLEDTLTCTGSVNLLGRTINCHNHAGHGTQDFTHGLMNSCNPWFVEVGQRLGVDTFMKYFEAFGFTEPTGIDLPAEFYPQKGINYYDKNTMTKLDLASCSFGQSFQISPLQMITAIAAIGNGGKLMQPYVVGAMTDAEGNKVWEKTPVVRRQVISEKVAAELAGMMEAVATTGGGQNAYVAGYHVAGKTGTSQKLETGSKYYVASFSCFAPAYDPEIAVIVVVDEPKAGLINGSSISAPVAGEIVENTLKYLNVEPRYTAKELAVLSDTAPALAGKSVAEAKRTAEGENFTVRIVGSGEKVLKQSPSAGSVIPKGGLVILYTEEGEANKATVPDLTGLTLSEANKRALNAGLNIRISGNFMGEGEITSYKQSVDKDSSVSMGTTVTVYFRNTTGGNDLDE